MADIPLETIFAFFSDFEWPVEDKSFGYVAQSIMRFHKKCGFLTRKQENAIRSIYRVRQQRIQEAERGVIYQEIPDSYYPETARRRKGHPRNNRPYKTALEYQEEEIAEANRATQ